MITIWNANRDMDKVIVLKTTQVRQGLKEVFNKSVVTIVFSSFCLSPFLEAALPRLWVFSPATDDSCIFLFLDTFLGDLKVGSWSSSSTGMCETWTSYIEGTSEASGLDLLGACELMSVE